MAIDKFERSNLKQSQQKLMRKKTQPAEASDFWKQVVFRIKYPFKIWIFELIDQWLLRQPLPKSKNPYILFTRLDLIGDYLMCRPFFQGLKGSPEFAGKKFIFAGNQIYSGLAEFLDAEAIQQFIWIDRAKFINSISYRYKILKEIRALNVEMCVNLSHTRQFFTESVCRISGARVKVRPESVGKYMTNFEQQISDSWYEQIIPTGKTPMFEFIRNQRFFQTLAPGMKLPQNLRTELDLPIPACTIPSRFVAFAPGASSPHRRWPVEKFSQVAEWLSTKWALPIVVLGGPADYELGEHCKSVSATVLNLCGMLSLPESLAVLQKAEVLVSNESAPVHMAATVATPALCLSQGNHFVRWNPYPPEVEPLVITLYPSKFYPLHQNWEILTKRYHHFSDYPIQEIEIEQVIAALDRILET